LVFGPESRMLAYLIFFYFAMDCNQVAAHHGAFKIWYFKVIKSIFKDGIIKLSPGTNTSVNNKQRFGIQIPFSYLAIPAIWLHIVVLQIICTLSAVYGRIVEGEPNGL